MGFLGIQIEISDGIRILSSNVARHELSVSETQEVSTFLVIPSAFLRSGIELSLSGSPFRVEASVATLEELRTRQISLRPESLIIVDGTARHDEMVESLTAVMAISPGSKVVVLVEACRSEELLAAFKQGVHGYLTTSVSQEALRGYLSLVMIGEFVMSTSALEMMTLSASDRRIRDPALSNEPWDGVERRSRGGLTLRETSILRLLMEGHSNKIIARRCDITESTVKVHIKSICHKTGVLNRTQAALWAKSHLHTEERRSSRSR